MRLLLLMYIGIDIDAILLLMYIDIDINAIVAVDVYRYRY